MMLLPWFPQTLFHPVPPCDHSLYLTVFRGIVNNQGTRHGTWVYWLACRKTEGIPDSKSFFRETKGDPQIKYSPPVLELLPTYLRQRGSYFFPIDCLKCVPLILIPVLDDSILSVLTHAHPHSVLVFFFPLHISFTQPGAGVGRHLL